MYKTLSLAIITFSLCISNAYTQAFDTDAEVVLKKLKSQKEVIRLRSISKTKGSSNEIQTRALKRITHDVMDTTKPIEETVQIQSFDIDDRVRLNINFEYGKSEISESSRSQLAMIATVLNDRSLKFLPVEVNGHTDSDGDDKYNLKLSYERANAVKEFLVNEYGIMAARLTVSGYGEGDPVAQNTSEQGKALNRRVEITLAQ